MKTKYILIGIALLALGLIAGRFLIPTTASAPATDEAHVHDSDEPATIWTCSMHPQIQQPEPGDCPICGMDLIPLTEDSDANDSPRTLRMSESSKALAEIETAPVVRKAAEHSVRLSGKLERAETQVKSLTARFPARVDQLYVDAVGLSVKQGQPLALIYSPELLSAQRELLAAHRRDPDGRFTEAARKKLLLWDLQPEQIEALLEEGAAKEQFELRAPTSGIVLSKQVNEGDYLKTGQALYTIADLSELWLTLDAYESDLPWLKQGQPVHFTLQSIPSAHFESTVDFIEPELNERTRTVPVRVVVDNSDGRLKPGMFAQATVQATSDKALLVPASAVLRTGQRAVVYVAVPDQEKPTYEGREIELGAKAGEYYVVASGLKENESVVTHGAFKIDSALQIKAKPSMMTMADEAPSAASADTDIWLPLIDPYLDLQAALAADDLNKSKQALKAMMAITGHSGEASELIHAMMAADTLDAIRRPHFEKLSNHLIEAVESDAGDIEQPLYKMHCPMVYPDRGADWLQASDELLNPYYGAMMLHCGEVKETIQ